MAGTPPHTSPAPMRVPFLTTAPADTMAPSPMLNLSMLGEIPLIGDLLVSRRGEGVFGMTYSINGPAAAPRVGVNPVSALTPGILRRIFEPVAPRDSGGGHSFQPEPPPEGDAAPDAAVEARHAEAAALYESLAKRPLRPWDKRLALLAAREYQAAGRLDDAGRMIRVATPVGRADHAALLARITAEVALARGRPTAAIDALQAVPEPWPAPLASELLALRARAELATGDTLDGIRTLEARALLLSGTDERRENYARLVGALSASPAVTATVPATATPYERAWYELGQLLAAATQADKEKLSAELIDAANNRGASVKKREDTHTNGGSQQGVCPLPLVAV